MNFFTSGLEIRVQHHTYPFLYCSKSFTKDLKKALLNTVIRFLLLNIHSTAQGGKDLWIINPFYFQWYAACNHNCQCFLFLFFKRWEDKELIYFPWGFWYFLWLSLLISNKKNFCLALLCQLFPSFQITFCLSQIFFTHTYFITYQGERLGYFSILMLYIKIFLQCSSTFLLHKFQQFLKSRLSTNKRLKILENNEK